MKPASPHTEQLCPGWRPGPLGRRRGDNLFGTRIFWLSSGRAAGRQRQQNKAPRQPRLLFELIQSAPQQYSRQTCSRRSRRPGSRAPPPVSRMPAHMSRRTSTSQRPMASATMAAAAAPRMHFCSRATFEVLHVSDCLHPCSPGVQAGLAMQQGRTALHQTYATSPAVDLQGSGAHLAGPSGRRPRSPSLPPSQSTAPAAAAQPRHHRGRQETEGTRLAANMHNRSGLMYITVTTAPMTVRD